MKKVLATLLAAVGAVVASASTGACLMLLFDEPEMFEE